MHKYLLKALAKSRSPNPSRANPSRLSIPIAIEVITAGFPSPAEDYMELGIDLNEELIKNPSSTFFLRVSGNSMTGVGIHNGDLLIIDRSLEARPGRIVVAILDGDFTIKRLTYDHGTPYLEAAHPNYPTIDLRSYGNVQIWGVATYSIHNLTSSSISTWFKQQH